MSTTVRQYVGTETTPKDMAVTYFWGGEDNKRSAQFTIGDKYICLSEAQIKDLIKVLQIRVREKRKVFKVLNFDRTRVVTPEGGYYYLK